MTNQKLNKEILEQKYVSEHERSHLTINWLRIGRAIDYYKCLGYQYVEVPWIVDPKYREITFAGEIGFSTIYGDLVGSAEQSFLALHYETIKNNGQSFLMQGNKKFVACTPCFRDHQEDDGSHMPYFMKVELFDNTSNKPEMLFCNAGKFFAHEGATLEKVVTDEGIDWVVGGLEVGSYGQKHFTINDVEHKWSYGTGLAEPRFSQALKIQEATTSNWFLDHRP